MNIAQYRGLALDPFQEEAIRAIDEGKSVLISAPTGAGKTLIAEYTIDRCLAEGKHLIYTAPIKALSNQKFRDFTARYGDRIGIKTGDVTLNPESQVTLMTTEVFRNTILEGNPRLDQVEYAIFDEIHFLDDRERGTVWEESIIYAPPRMKFVCLSATIPNLEQIAQWIRSIRDGEMAVITETTRPVPLRHFLYAPGRGVVTIPELQALERRKNAPGESLTHHGQWRRRLTAELAEHGRFPAIYFAFNRRECEELAHAVHMQLFNDAEKQQTLDLYDSLCKAFSIEQTGEAAHLRTMLAKGTAYHHAGLLPTLKEIVERMFTSGLLKLLFATETFALGVNMPARTVVFNSLTKFDGVRQAPLMTREFHQMAGRAGRRGMDAEGYVYAVIDWPAVRAATADRILNGQTEPVRSQFNLSYSTILNLYGHLQERIYGVCEKSLSNFQGKRNSTDKLRQMKKKIDVLKTFDYIRGGKLTPKGVLATKIYGYEIHITELFFGGILEELDEVQLAVALCAVVYEGRRGIGQVTVRTKEFRRLKRDVLDAILAVCRIEKEETIEEPLKEPDFRLSAAVMAWMHGRSFDELEHYTGAAPGDIVRSFRQTIQLVRQVQNALERGTDLRARLSGVLARMNRDEIDAERQLRMGIEQETGT